MRKIIGSLAVCICIIGSLCFSANVSANSEKNGIKPRAMQCYAYGNMSMRLSTEYGIWTAGSTRICQDGYAYGTDVQMTRPYTTYAICNVCGTGEITDRGVVREWICQGHNNLH